MKSIRSATGVDAHVGARMRLRRMLLGMSQEKLGESLGVTFQQIQKYERGANRISASKLYEVSQMLGVPVQYFYDELPGNDEKPLARPQNKRDHEESFLMDFVRSPEGLSLNRAYAGIPNEKLRRLILDMIKALSIEEER